MLSRDLRCHSHTPTYPCGDVVGFLGEIRTGSRSIWERAVCLDHVNSSATYRGDVVYLRPVGSHYVSVGSPCGAWAITEFFEGSPRSERWCERTDGPCPFPGAPVRFDRYPDDGDARPCAARTLAFYVENLEQHVAARAERVRVDG